MTRTVTPSSTPLTENTRAVRFAAPPSWGIAAGFGLISSLWSYELFYNAFGVHGYSLAAIMTCIMVVQGAASVALSRGSRNGRFATIALAAIVGVFHIWYLATVQATYISESVQGNGVAGGVLLLLLTAPALLAPYITLAAATHRSCVEYCNKL